MKKHWYKEFVIFCPPCGGEDVYRERVYGDKPKEPEARRETVTEMCYQCKMSMFL